jgi:hypothetical protein
VAVTARTPFSRMFAKVIGGPKVRTDRSSFMGGVQQFFRTYAFGLMGS